MSSTAHFGYCCTQLTLMFYRLSNLEASPFQPTLQLEPILFNLIYSIFTTSILEYFNTNRLQQKSAGTNVGNPTVSGVPAVLKFPSSVPDFRETIFPITACSRFFRYLIPSSRGNIPGSLPSFFVPFPADDVPSIFTSQRSVTGSRILKKMVTWRVRDWFPPIYAVINLCSIILVLVW